jgi:hypothetical protein
MRIGGRRVACGPDLRELRWRRQCGRSGRPWAVRPAGGPLAAEVVKAAEPPESPEPPSSPESPERRLEALARSGGALRRVLCALAGRFAAAKAWEELGFARTGDYAVEALGLSPRTLQEWARVDLALEALPRVEAALAAGRLPWSKVRLLARAATPGDEALWVAAAKRLTVRQLEREVRAVSRHAVEAGGIEADEEGLPAVTHETVQVRCTGVVNAKWWAVRRLAQRVAGEKLPVWGCMELVAAEVLSAIPMAPAAEAPGPDRAAEAGARERTGALADVCAAQDVAGEDAVVAPEPRTATAAPVELPPFLLPLVRDLSELDAAALHLRLVAAVRLEQRLTAQMVPLLARVQRGRLYRARGFANVGDYARERLGISPRKASALLRLDRAARACPALLEAYASGALSWVKAHALVPVLLPDELGRFHAVWIARARRVTVRRLDDEVGRALVLLETDRARFLTTGGLVDAEAEAEARGDSQTCARATGAGEPEDSRIFFLAPIEQARFFRAALCTVRLRLERATGRLPTEGEALEAMLDHCLDTWNSWNWEGRKRYPVFERDGWRCTVAGCSSYRNLQDHHIVFRSRGGSDELSNRTTVCAYHHHRGIHAGRIRCTGSAPEHLYFELGLRPGRRPLLSYRGDELIHAATDSPAAATTTSASIAGTALRQPANTPA